MPFIVQRFQERNTTRTVTYILLGPIGYHGFHGLFGCKPLGLDNLIILAECRNSYGTHCRRTHLITLTATVVVWPLGNVFAIATPTSIGNSDLPDTGTGNI